ncbi:protogenin B-like isoform X1 [Leptopilina heterotoma]|uniref:protogenin B-like isoform X1 n=1 Tax=Leptopilina heterotoma TaxID=63436 RepID=UPI001CA88434|nr:protogenin B-like isoform X1 [Leptopilina heterotoma]
MAARVLLLSILFTEVLKPVYCTGIEEIVGGINERNGGKQDNLDPNDSKNWRLSLEIESKGPVILGKKGTTLSCNVKSKQEITWLYNGDEAPPCGIARCSVHRNGTLHFYKQKKSLDILKPKNSSFNNGSKTLTKDEFRCVVRTNCGGYLRSSPVIVQVAKLARSFKEQPQNVKVQEGEVARLSCSIESLPSPPKITWEHNSKPLLFDDNSKKYTFIPPGVLYINATQLSDAGDYRCVAVNEYLNKTTTSAEAKLTVSNSRDYSASSLLPQTSNNYVLNENSSLQLACAVSGYPSSIPTWSFLPRNSINKTKLRFLVNSTSGISLLNLQNVVHSDSGVYTCAARNSLNKSMEYQQIKVDVLVPPTFLKKPTYQGIPNGMTGRFECQAQGYPTPRIYWLKDAKNITINERRTISEKGFNEMELMISNTVQSDSGVYQCVAVNDVGEIWAAGRLQVIISRNNPDAPTNLKCRALSSKKILISWEPPKYLPTTNITAYTVHYSPVEGGREEVSLPELGNVTSVEITKLLEPFTNYTFYVRFYNNHGASDQSTTITCSTSPSVPKSAPKISLSVIGDTKLNVTWKPLSKKQAQGIVTQYKLQWRLHQHPSSLVRYFNSSVEQHLLNDLNPGAQYDVRVLARTEEGWPSINEAQFTWTTVTMPSPEIGQFFMKKIVNVSLASINASAVSMKWSLNEKLNRNYGLELKLWKVYVEDENGEKLTLDLLPKNTTEYLFTNLEAHTYTMGLCMLTVNEATKCINKRIESANTSLSNIPTALEAIPMSANSINLTWNIANSYRNNIFEVCYHAVHIMKDTSNCLLINDTTTLIEDLKPYTLYQFKIRVVLNDPEQTSEFSQAIECYTGEDIPGKVEDVHWFLGNSTLVRVAWKEPRKINGLVRNYYVVYTMDLSKSDTWENLTVPGNKTQTNLTGLLSGRRYFVMVQAATTAGKGKLSDPIIIVAGSSSSKIPSSSDGRRPSSKTRSDQNLGVILGLSISIVCIGLCLFSMYCRKKWETSRSLRETPQPLKNSGLVRNGNGCCLVDRSSIPVNQHVSHFMGNEIELSVLCPPTTTPHLDTKGSHPNGVIELGAKEPLLQSWHSNGDTKDLRITENPQYKARGGNASSKQQEQGLNDTQLTMVNCTLRSSANSLNNNLGGFGSETSSEKITSNNSFPILEPNG